MTSRHRHPDVFILGAGPAGLAAAIAAAEAGLSVQVADASYPPIDKACGEGLMPGSCAALTRLGVDLAEAATAPLRGIRFIGHGRSAEAHFPAGFGRGIRRTALHPLLQRRAEELGVRLRWNTPFRGASPGAVELPGEIVRPRWLIGADGAQSRIRDSCRLARASTSSRRFGLRQHFRLAPWSEFVEVYWSSTGQAYVTPIAPDEVCVAFLSRSRHPSVASALAGFPLLQSLLGSAPATDAPRGAVTLSRKLHRVTSGSTALLGDASGSVDAITGEGLGLCFRQSLALVDALRHNNLELYEIAHHRLARLPRFMAQSLLLLDRSRHLQARVLSAFSRRPELFASMLRVHVGEDPPHLLGPSGMLGLGLRLLTSWLPAPLAPGRRKTSISTFD